MKQRYGNVSEAENRSGKAELNKDQQRKSIPKQRKGIAVFRRAVAR